MFKPGRLYRLRIGILAIGLVSASLLVMVSNLEGETGSIHTASVQTKSNSGRKKKIKKVVKAKMNDVRPTVVPPGSWGGSGIRLVVGPNSTAIEYDCAQGEITDVLATDKNGFFDAKGIHIRQHGGPLRENSPDPRQGARYTGRILENQMTLKVTLIDKDVPIGEFHLEMGKNVRLHKCM